MPTTNNMDHHHHQPTSPSMHSVLVQGEVLSGRALEEYAAKWGLCGICAAHKTHNRVDRLFHKTSFEPITAVNPETGQYTIYKGYCLQPTCYTLVEAQELLGERSSGSLRSFPSSPSNKRKSTSRSSSNNSTSSSDTFNKHTNNKVLGSPSSSTFSSNSSGKSITSIMGNHRSCSSGLDFLAEASESSMPEPSTWSHPLSPQQQKVKAIRERMHASYSGPDTSASTRRLTLSPRSPESFEGTKSILLANRHPSSSLLMTSHGSSRSVTSSTLLVGPITPSLSSSSSVLSRKQAPCRQTVPACDVLKTGVPAPPPPPPYCSLYGKQAAPRCRLQDNGPLASPSALEINVSPRNPTSPEETKRIMTMKYASESSLMASTAGMNIALDQGTNNRCTNNKSWDQTVYRPATTERSLKDASIYPFTPIAAKRHPCLLDDTASPTSFVAQELEDAFCLGNVPMLVQILQRRRSVLDHETASRALEYLRKSLVPSQRTETAVVYYPEMASIVCDILRQQFVVDATATTTIQESNDDVASQGVLVLMSMAAVSRDYARDIWTSNGTDVLLALLTKQTQYQRQSSGAVNPLLQERCAGALEVLTGTLLDITPQDRDFTGNEMITDRLVDVLLAQLNAATEASSSSCPSHAIRALYNILCKWPSNLSMWEKMSQSFRDNTEMLWNMLVAQDISEAVKEAVLCILLRLHETSKDDNLLSSKRLSLLMTFLRKDRPLPLHLATVELLEASTVVVPKGNAALIIARICKTLKLHETHERIHLAGIRVIHNLLQQTNDILQPAIVKKLIGSTTRIMSSFKDNMSVQHPACVILATLGDDVEHGKSFVLSQAGVKATIHAFQGIFSCNAPADAKCAVTSVFARLLQQPLSTTDAEPCLLLLVEKVMRQEPEPALKGHLLRIIQNLLMNMLPMNDNVTMNVPTSNITDCILDILDQQQRSPRDVRQCLVLLATIYSCVHFTPGDHDGSITLVQLGTGQCVQLKTHSTKEFVTLWNVLATGPNMHDPDILMACCCALSNYLGPLCALLGTVTDDAALDQALGRRELRISSEMLRILHGTMIRNKTNVDVTVHAMELFRILVLLSKAEVLNRWMAAIVSLMVESMEEWNSNDKITSFGLNLFACLLQKARDFTLLSRQGCFRVIVGGLGSDNEVTALQTAGLLAELLANNSSTASNGFCATTDACNSIIQCMAKHVSSSEIQRQCCRILQKGIGSQVHVHQIATDQGLKAIANALERHSGLAELVKPACWVLHKMLVDMETNVLWENRQLVGAAAIACMHNSIDATTTKAIVNVWLHLCSKKDYFKMELIASMPLLLDAMRVNLDDVDLQLSACSIIKLLCNFGEGQKLAGSMGAVDSVINALLGHRGSARLVKEGFVALKMLMWEEAASILLEPLEISETVVCLARIHLGDPAIQIEALAIATLDNTTVLKDVVLEWGIQVMQQHRTNEAVQQRACLFLKTHMFHSTSCWKMKKQYYQLQELLFSSGELFWETCGLTSIEISNRIMT